MISREFVKNEIYDKALIGMPQKDIGKKLGVSQTTVSRLLRDDQVKAVIEKCKAELVERSYETAVNNVIGVIEDYEKPVQLDDKGRVKGDDFQRKEHGFKASLRVMESMGLIESRTQPAFVQNILVQNNNNQYFSPLTDRALSQAMTAIDAEIIDNESEVQENP